jgi:hypothetical protein
MVKIVARKSESIEVDKSTFHKEDWLRKRQRNN